MLASSGRRIQELLTAEGGGVVGKHGWSLDSAQPFVQKLRHVVIYALSNVGAPFHCLIRSLWGLSRTGGRSWGPERAR